MLVESEEGDAGGDFGADSWELGELLDGALERDFGGAEGQQPGGIVVVGVGVVGLVATFRRLFAQEGDGARDVAGAVAVWGGWVRGG